MSSTCTLSQSVASNLDPPPYPVRRFSIEEYYKLVDVGLLDENDNCELLEGWIVPKEVKTPRHDNTIDMLLGTLLDIMPDNWFLRVQNVLETPNSAPEPDLAVARGECGRFCERHPQGEDVGLVIEVADSSIEISRRKALIYAAAGVPRYWIINLPKLCVEVLDNPQPGSEGVRYAALRIIHSSDEVELVLDDQHVARISVAKLLPAG